LSATDDLITATQGEGADFRDLLTTELGAYEVSRVSMDGPAVFLPAKLAITMAMLVHELATNAAKYGSLSTESGMVSLNWSLSEDAFKFLWRETGGPTVTKPTRRGFGLGLLSDALGQFKGMSETVFVPTGLVCKIRATRPRSALNPALGAGDAGTESLPAE